MILLVMSSESIIYKGRFKKATPWNDPIYALN